MRRGLLVALLFCSGCPQTVVVFDDAGTADGAVGDAAAGDGGDPRDPPDASTTQDAGALDAGAPDAGGACAGLPDCVTLTPEPARANVRETVTVRAEVDNPSGAELQMALCDPALEPRRAPGRPPLVLDEIEYALELADPTTGEFTFAVTAVPPWFVATTFTVQLCITEGGQGPARRAAVDIHVRGNVLVAAGYQGIFAVASDGRPARGKGGAHPEGKLADDSIGRVTAVRMASDGTLLAYDDDARPPRIARYALEGTDLRLATFAHLEADLGGAEPIAYDNVAVYSIAELPDGRFALASTHNSGTPSPRVMLWNPDGSFSEAVVGPNPSHLWHSVAARRPGELLVGMGYNIRGQVLRIDPASGEALGGPLTDDIRKYIFALEPLPDERVVLAGERFVAIASDGGGYIPVSELPDDFRDWRGIARFDDRILVANNHQDDAENVAIIAGRRFVGWFRAPDVGGPVIVPNGITYLE